MIGVLRTYHSSLSVMSNSLLQRQTSLPAHIVQFSRFLRTKGFDIGPTEEKELLIAYTRSVPTSFEAQKNLYKAIWVKNRKQFLVFEELYDTYWQELAKAENSKTKEIGEEKQQAQKTAKQQSSLQVLKKWLYNGRIEEEQEVAAYSAFEAISKKDFSSFLSGEQKELLEIIRIISKRLANKHSRRYVKTKSSAHIDLKNTISTALRKGLEINQFKYKKQQKRKVNIILICDVSKSMELYSQFLIEFMYSFQQAVHQLRTFVFSTKLLHLSNALKDSDYKKVLNNLSEQIPYWSGGTRIGESLYQFKRDYGERLLNRDTIVLILSDGWDTGDLDLLESSMKYIHKKSDRVIWLNPLASNPSYTPSTKGMEIAMPYIDVFTSAHNLDSLKGVVKHLQKKKYQIKNGN